jgi:predicted enzyme related to lactoylglutathione lyase
MLTKQQMGPQMLGVFPYDAPAISGCVIAGAGFAAGGAGAVIYLNADPTLAAVVNRVAAAGGQVLVPHFALPEGMGFWAHIIDTEGNRVGLHAMA